MCSDRPAPAGAAATNDAAHAARTTTARAAARRARIAGRLSVPTPTIAEGLDSLAAMTIRVVVAEDNYLVREAVTRLLDTDDDIEVVGVCEDFDGLLAAVDTDQPDVIITDIRMPPTGTDEGV